MAEYYPLLAKAVGSLPNSTPESRRVVYERARKALIGQLRTLHPPVPDEDIESESVALDRAIERLETELANGGVPTAPPVPAPASAPPSAPAASPVRKTPAKPAPLAKTPLPPKPPGPKAPSAPKPPIGPKPAAPSDLAEQAPAPPLEPPALPEAPNGLGAAPPPPGRTGPADKRPPLPVRAKVPKPPSLRPSDAPASSMAPPGPPPVSAEIVTTVEPALEEGGDGPSDSVSASIKRLKPPRPDLQRPIAPQPVVPAGPKRRLWIIPAVIFVVGAVVAFAAWKLRDRPDTIAHKPAEQTQTDSGKIAERVGGTPPSTDSAGATPPVTEPKNPPDQNAQQPESQAPGTAPQSQQPGTAAPSNPELPVAHRAALLVEAPDEPNKVKTFLGTVVWKLNNVPQGPNDAVGLAVEADIDLPDDKLKAVITFAKNTEASLPASHTINIRFVPDTGSFTGDVKQISVPQMRPESSPSGEPLAGVTVQIVPNSFLVGLSPGNAETANTDLMRRLQWIDIPMLLDSGKIAKLTFEKSESGQRDLTEALDAWAKQ